MRWRLPVAALAVVVVAAGCSGGDAETSSTPTSVLHLETLAVTSPAFEDGANMPERFSCEGDNVPPPLRWTDIPEETSELVVVMTDPDAPSGTFVHWTVWGIDPSLTGIDGVLPDGAVEGTTSSGKATYIGPCPPNGETYRYHFEVIALSGQLPLEAGASVEELRDEVEDLAISSGILTGRFGR
jgi:Raf kinase inhibitor-like YbhB/YbcL family protein